MHDLPLLINIAVALVVAFIGGVIARRVGLPPIAGYLMAGIVIGPFTPGFVGDTETISQLAELGVIFLMFGVGLHFSLKDLWKVRSVAIPGATSPHRMPADQALCLYYPVSPTGQRWQPVNGLLSLIDLARDHIFFEDYWRATGAERGGIWLGAEAAHGFN